MADASRVVEIVFQGVDRMGAGVDSARSKMDSLNSAVSGVTGPMSSFTTGLIQFEAGLLAAGVAAGGLAITLAGDFDAQFREIATLLDLPLSSLQDFKEQIQTYAATSTQSFDQINNAVYTAISAGSDYQDSLALVAEAEKLATAGKADLGSTTTVLVSALNAYGLGMSEAAQFSDLLFQTVKSGQTTLPELSASLANVTGLASTAGVDFGELMAAIAALTATGSGTSEAITQIRGALSNMIKPSQQATKLADDLGITFNATALKSEGFAGMLQQVAEATGGNTEQMALLFGDVEALNGALTLTGNGADKFASTITAMGTAAGQTETAYNKMVGALAADKMVNAFKMLGVEIGTPLVDAFGGVQEAIAEIFNALSTSVSGGKLQGFINQIDTLFDNLQQNMEAVADNLPEALESADYSGFYDGIELLKTAFTDMFDGVDLTTTEGLSELITQLGIGFESLTAFVVSAIEGIGPFITQLGELTGFIMSLDPEVVAVVGTLGGLSVVFTTISTVVAGVSATFAALAGSGGIIAGVSSVLAGLATVLTGPVGIAVAVGAAAYGVYELGSSLLDLEEGAEWTSTKLSESADQISYLGTQSLETIQDLKDAIAAGTVVWDSTKEAYIDIGQTFEDTVQDMNTSLDGFEQNTADSLDGVNQSIIDGKATFVENFKAMIDETKTSATASEDLANLRTSLEELFAEGLIDQQQFTQLKDYLTQTESAGKTAEKALKDSEKAGKESAAALQKAEQQAQKFQIAMEEIASDERIKTFELAVDLKTAQIEADTQRIQAAFSSLDNTVSNTGDTVSSLWNTLADGADLSLEDRWALSDDIEQENQRRDEALSLQKELIKAQITAITAKTNALKNGDGLIRIESDGLEPALEMIMWEVLEKVQLKANAEGAELLLGI